MRVAHPFSGGLKLAHADGWRLDERELNRGVRRAVRELAMKGHLPVSECQTQIHILTRKDLRRAKGVGVVENGPAPKKVVKALIASGMPVGKAKGVKWVSIW